MYHQKECELEGNRDEMCEIMEFIRGYHCSLKIVLKLSFCKIFLKKNLFANFGIDLDLKQLDLIRL